MNIEDKVIKLEISIQSQKEQLLELRREIKDEIVKTRQEAWGDFKFLAGLIFWFFFLYQILAHW